MAVAFGPASAWTIGRTMLERCVAGATSIWMLEPYLRKQPRPGGRASCSSRHRLPTSCGAYGHLETKAPQQAALQVPTSSSPPSPLSNRQLGRRLAYQWSYDRSCWQQAGSDGTCCRRDHWCEDQREMRKPSLAPHRCSRAQRCTTLLGRYWRQRPAALLPGGGAAPKCSGPVGPNCQVDNHLPGQQ